MNCQPALHTPDPMHFLHAPSNPPLAPGIYPTLIARPERTRRDATLTLPEGAPAPQRLFPCGSFFDGQAWSQRTVLWYLPGPWRPSGYSICSAYLQAQAAWIALDMEGPLTVEADAEGLIWRRCHAGRCVTARSGAELAKLTEDLKKGGLP